MVTWVKPSTLSKIPSLTEVSSSSIATIWICSTHLVVVCSSNNLVWTPPPTNTTFLDLARPDEDREETRTSYPRPSLDIYILGAIGTTIPCPFFLSLPLVYHIFLSSWDPILVMCFTKLGKTTSYVDNKTYDEIETSTFLQIEGLQSISVGEPRSSTTIVFSTFYSW